MAENQVVQLRRHIKNWLREKGEDHPRGTSRQVLLERCLYYKYKDDPKSFKPFNPTRKNSYVAMAEITGFSLVLDERGGVPKYVDKTCPTKKRVKQRNTQQTSFYESDEWRALRYKALELNGGACQCCGRSRKHGVVLHVDHIKPRSKYPELQLALDNLQILCEDCNLGKSNKFATDWR